MLTKIQSICFCPYQLHTNTQLNAKTSAQQHHGFLLRIEFKQLGYGYADCRPWPELGDAPLAFQLRSLAQKTLTPLLQKSMAFALLDAQARAEKKWLFANSTLPRNRFTASHFLSLAEIEKLQTQGFQKIKLKCGKHVEQEIAYLKEMSGSMRHLHMQWQLDFNGAIDLTLFKYFMEESKEILHTINCIEDPIPFDAPAWQSIQAQYGIPLALDRLPVHWTQPPHPEQVYQMIVVKPALAEKKDLQYFPGRVVFTSYFDHPFGQVCGLYEAAQFYAQHPTKKEDCGFLTHLNYTMNPYAVRLRIQNTQLIPPQGMGFGFDDLLAQEQWSPLEHHG